MLRRDSELLARMSRTNTHMGAAVVELLEDLEDGQLSASRLRAIGKALGELSADVLARAAEVDGRMVDGVERVVIDARP